MLRPVCDVHLHVHDFDCRGQTWLGHSLGGLDLRSLVFAGSAAVVLAGCATSYPVYVRVEPTGEEFIGQADSTMLGKSTVRLTNSSGLSCTGEYQAEMVMSGSSVVTTKGTITCPDGRVGTWVVTGDGSGGQGVGNLQGEKVRVYFGSFVTRQQLERP